MQEKYSRIQIFFHWLSLLFIILTYLSVKLKSLDLTYDWHQLMMSTHFTLGICVWLIVIIRIGLRHLYLSKTPAITPTPPVWQTKLAHYVHLALYLVFILLPILGSLTVLNKGFAVSFVGFPILSGFTANPGLAHTLKEIHETLANGALILIALHAIAALYHHYIVKDNTLLRMMPHKSK